MGLCNMQLVKNKFVAFHWLTQMAFNKEKPRRKQRILVKEKVQLFKATHWLLWSVRGVSGCELLIRQASWYLSTESDRIGNSAELLSTHLYLWCFCLFSVTASFLWPSIFLPFSHVQIVVAVSAVAVSATWLATWVPIVNAIVMVANGRLMTIRCAVVLNEVNVNAMELASANLATLARDVIAWIVMPTAMILIILM